MADGADGDLGETLGHHPLLSSGLQVIQLIHLASPVLPENLPVADAPHMRYYNTTSSIKVRQMPAAKKITRTHWRCRARRKSGLGFCRLRPVPGKSRCRFHGGLSTGPKTQEGKAVVVAAMVEGRKRWIERMKAEGKKFPTGRKPKIVRDSKVKRVRDELLSLRREIEADERNEPPSKRRPGRPSKEETIARLRAALIDL
jgi:hypothetical protein